MTARGFTVVEVLIAAVLLAIISMAIATTMSNTAASQRSIQAKDLQRDVMSEISDLLSNRVACLNTFGGNNPQTPFTVTSLKDAANAAKFSVGANHSSQLLRFTEFKLENWQPDATAPNQGTSKLTVSLTKTGTIIGPKDIKQQLTIRLKLNAANSLIDCFTLGNSSEFWKSSPMDVLDIFYNGGNVGIGTSNPAAALDVAGGIKLNNDTSACDATHAGTMRWTGSAFEGCNGISWAPLGGGGTLSVDVWVCPLKYTCDDGQNVNGSWASYTCQGQIQNRATCSINWHNAGAFNCENACTYLGKLRIN